MSQHRKSPATQPFHRRHLGGGRGAPVAVGLGALLLAGGGTAAVLGFQDGSGDGRARTAASGEQTQLEEQRVRTAAVERAEKRDTDKELAELERARTQERRTMRSRAASTAREERQEKRRALREKAEKEAAQKKATESEPEKAPAGGTGGTGVSADESRLVSLLNERRAEMGLSEVEESGGLAAEAEECSAASLDKGALEHCGHEVLFMGGENTTPENMLEAWFNSPGHKTALTYGSSTEAGAGIVTDDSGRLVSAITIDY